MRRSGKTHSDTNSSLGVDTQSTDKSVGGRDIAKKSLEVLRTALSIALFLPCSIVIQASGRSGTLMLSLGGIICYILDLFQWMEVSYCCAHSMASR